MTCRPPVFCTLPYLPVVLHSSMSSLLTHSLPMGFSWASSRMLIRMCVLYVHFGMCIIPLQLCIFLVQVSLWLSTESSRKQKKSSQTSRLPKFPFQTSLTQLRGTHSNYIRCSKTLAHAIFVFSAWWGGHTPLQPSFALLPRPRRPACSGSPTGSLPQILQRHSRDQGCDLPIPPPPRPWFGSKTFPTIKGPLVTRGTRNRCESQAALLRGK